MQFRMSAGAECPDPGATAGTASVVGDSDDRRDLYLLVSGCGRSVDSGAYRFSPERIVERPVPPPIETMRRGPFAALNRDRFVGRTITAY